MFLLIFICIIIIILSLFLVTSKINNKDIDEYKEMLSKRSNITNTTIAANNMFIVPNASICEFSLNMRDLNMPNDTWIYKNGVNLIEVCKNYNAVLLQIEGVGKNLYLNKTYILEKYDCTQFSKDLIKQLDLIGVKSTCAFGRKYEYGYQYGPHTWILANIRGNIIPIEAVGGYIIYARDYNVNYKIIKVGECV